MVAAMVREIARAVVFAILDFDDLELGTLELR
jgi:hypothetical protein